MTYDSEVAADSPWGYWKTDETSGTTLADSSGNGKAMTITGSPTLAQTGPSGASDAIDWPSSTVTYAKNANSSPLAGANGFTIEAWVYLTANPGGVAAVVGEGANATGTSNTEFGLSIDTSGRPVFYMFNTAVRNLTGSALSLNTWHHIVAVGSTSAGMSLRVDKVADGTLAENSLASTYSRALWIHASGRSNAGGPVKISHAAFYSAPLTTTRIDAHYDAMIAGGGVTGTLASTTAGATLAASGAETFTGTLAATTGDATLAASGTVANPQSGTLAASLLVPTASLTGSYVGPPSGTLAATLTVPVADFTGTHTPPANPTGSLAATLPVPAVDFTGGYTPPTIAGTLGASLPLLVANFTGTTDEILGSLAAVLPLPAVSLSGLYLAPIVTDTSNLFDGLDMMCVGMVTKIAPTVTPPTNVGERVVKAVPYPLPVLVNGRPT